jgi:hypothetical protein
MPRDGTRTNEPVSPQDSSAMSIERSRAFASDQLSFEQFEHEFLLLRYVKEAKLHHGITGSKGR